MVERKEVNPVKPYREDEDNDERRCSLFRPRPMMLMALGTIISCPIHGQHDLGEEDAKNDPMRNNRSTSL